MVLSSHSLAVVWNSQRYQSLSVLPNSSALLELVLVVMPTMVGP